jgi:tryptophan synthase alpha chain
MLENYIKNTLKEKDILLMTHIVAGYPNFEDSYKIIKSMVNAGVDLMELQIPFSEPIADGPVILNANQVALQNGATVQKCLELAKRVSNDFDIPFLFMSYCNIIYKYGISNFVKKSAEFNLKGMIIPDLPHEEGKEYLSAMNENNLDPIFLFSPTTTLDRMKEIATYAKGFVYCVARKGVTGLDTSFSDSLDKYLADCKKATNLPLALGFGVKEKKDVDFLKDKIEIAVIGTETIRLIDNKGINAIEGFIKSLR